MTKQQETVLMTLFDRAKEQAHVRCYTADLKGRTLGALWRKGFILWSGESWAALTDDGRGRAYQIRHYTL
jgi:hypothetical protein